MSVRRQNNKNNKFRTCTMCVCVCLCEAVVDSNKDLRVNLYEKNIYYIQRNVKIHLRTQTFYRLEERRGRTDGREAKK